MEIMLVLAVTGVVAAIAVPMMTNQLAFYRLSGDARSVANATGLAKMRAASVFGHERLYVDLVARSYRLETLDKTTSTCCWIADGAAGFLSQNVSYSFGVVGTPPPNTQAAIAQSLLCKNNAAVDIANTACIIFNSRGLPIDNANPGQPFVYGLYVTDGTAVYGITVSATGTVRSWRTRPLTVPVWTPQ